MFIVGHGLCEHILSLLSMPMLDFVVRPQSSSPITTVLIDFILQQSCAVSAQSKIINVD